MKEYGLVLFTRRTGKIEKSFTALGHGLLTMWALQNTTKNKDSIVFDLETGMVHRYYEGTDDFPKVIKGTEEHINDYCSGLLETFQEGRA